MNAGTPGLFAPCIVHITAGSPEEAGLIAQTLVSERLAACCTILPRAESWYWWEGAVQHNDECLLQCKTSRERFASLRDRVMELHSYDVPEIVMIPIEEGSERYLRWMEESVGRAI